MSNDAPLVVRLTRQEVAAFDALPGKSRSAKIRSLLHTRTIGEALAESNNKSLDSLNARLQMIEEQQALLHGLLTKLAEHPTKSSESEIGRIRLGLAGLVDHFFLPAAGVDRKPNLQKISAFLKADK